MSQVATDTRPGMPAAADERATTGGLLVYLLTGVAFGLVLTKGEAISWFRMQEMFRFQGFHMYGVFATALPVAILSVQLMKRFGVRTARGRPITIPPKELGRGSRYVLGGIIFGMGWAFTGACPGPLFALVGAGFPVFAVALVAALAGTWTYGLLRPKLPH
jgi:uncharacterized protein